MGGRLDHTYANLQALLYLARHGAAGFLLGGGTAASVVENGELSFPAGRTGILSVFCPNGEARGVTLRGLRNREMTIASFDNDKDIGIV